MAARSSFDTGRDPTPSAIASCRTHQQHRSSQRQTVLPPQASATDAKSVQAGFPRTESEKLLRAAISGG